MKRMLTNVKSEEMFYRSSFLVLLTVLNYRILHAWFIIDDTANIFCSSFGTLQLLFDRDIYLYFNQMFFTPLLPVSFKLDWLLFKMNPFGYHLHNLFVAFLCCLLLYELQKSYMSPFFAWIGTLLFAYSLPVSFDIGWITRKQYLWGFLFALLALYFFKKRDSTGQKYFLLFSLISMLVSLLCKEAYAFLPAAIFILAAGPMREKSVKTLPYFLILITYIIWRIYMLGSFGGYPGSTDRSVLFFMQKLFQLPMNLSENLYGFSFLPFLLLVILAFIKLQMLLPVACLIVIVISPFVFYPGGGFILANKALSFVAVITFTIACIAHNLFLKYRRTAVIVFLLCLIPIIYGSTVKIMNGQNLVIKLSESYERASREIIGARDEKILIVGNFSYYFSNLEDIYRKMLRTGFPSIISLSNPIAIPYLGETDFDRIILLNNLDLNPDTGSSSSVEVLAGHEAKQYMSENLNRSTNLPPPSVNFIPTQDHVKIEIGDSRSGIFWRCLYMGSYTGCYPIPRKYVFQYNTVKKVDKIDIIYQSEQGEMSRPATFRP